MIRESRKVKADLPDADDLRRRYRHGAAFETGTTGEYLLGWLEERRRAQDVTSNTLRGYESHIRRVFLPAFGDVPLDKLRAAHVGAAFDAVDTENARIAAGRASDDPAIRKSVAGKRPAGPSTKQRMRATLRTALADAANPDHPLITVNVAKLARIAQAPQPRPRMWTAERVDAFWKEYRPAVDGIRLVSERLMEWKRLSRRPFPVMVWTPAQAGTFLDAVADDRLYALWHLFCYRGLRRGEACGLRWADTDLAGARLNISTQLKQEGWLVVEDTTEVGGVRRAGRARQRGGRSAQSMAEDAGRGAAGGGGEVDRQRPGVHPAGRPRLPSGPAD